jgi:hypothetical protein
MSWIEMAYQAEIEQCREERAKRANGNGSKPQRYCDCIELKDANGNRRPFPEGHNCEYMAQRNALIPKAARIATEAVGNPLGNNSLSYLWCAEFGKAMDRLSEPLLRR